MSGWIPLTTRACHRNALGPHWLHRVGSLLATLLLAVSASALSIAHAQAPTQTADAANGKKKVLRYAFNVAETSFDPGYVTDLYSTYVIATIFDAPLTYDYLARPFKVKPNVTDLPQVNAEGTEYIFTVKPGIFFQDHPAFKGKKRELVAEDFVYSIKRHYDPKVKSGNLYQFQQLMKVSGMRVLLDKHKATGKFDYDLAVEGLQALDKYRFRIKLDAPDHNFIYRATHSMFSAMAREVVEAHGDAIGEHPVGTGPFKLGYWKRSSRIVLERNPGFREVFWDAEAPAGDAWAADIVKRLKGKRLPLLDQIEIAIIEEPQPRWLAFLNEEHDFVERVPEEFASKAFPGGKLAANLARRGLQMDRLTRLELTYSYFNMDDPIVGGYTPDKIALRRALVLAYDNDEEKNIARKGQAIVAQSPISPGCYGYDPAFFSDTTEYDPARARALLDLFGYKDIDGDGYREMPDGSPLKIVFNAAPEGLTRTVAELWLKNGKAIGINFEARFAKWPDLLRESNAGKLQMWSLGWSTVTPDGESFHLMLYGPNRGQANRSRFALAAYDRLFEQAKQTPHGPARDAIWREANRVFLVYAPWKLGMHRITTNLSQPWVVGYRMNPVMNSVWRYVDIDLAVQTREAKR
jgi:ABC-type transport system substrate-binding protein